MPRKVRETGWSPPDPLTITLRKVKACLTRDPPELEPALQAIRYYCRREWAERWPITTQTHIAQLNLPLRTSNLLEARGIHFVGDLIGNTEALATIKRSLGDKKYLGVLEAIQRAAAEINANEDDEAANYDPDHNPDRDQLDDLHSTSRQPTLSIETPKQSTPFNETTSETPGETTDTQPPQPSEKTDTATQNP